MKDYLDLMADSIRESLKFPERTTAHGFDLVLGPESFREIDNKSREEQDEEPGTISSIDGGSFTILKTPTEAFVLNRVYCNKFQGMKKLDFFQRVTFISRTRVVTEGDMVFFDTEAYPVEGECAVVVPRVDSADDEFRVGRMRGELERAISMARRFCEWGFVKVALGSGADFILMDGALQTGFPMEHTLADAAYNEASSRGITIAGLSKTSTIFTSEGYPLAGLLDVMARGMGLTKWMVKVGRTDEWAHRAMVHFVRLHEGSDRGFRLDVFEETAESDLDRLVDSLQSNSRYFAFPGYPYSLIDAHTYAKVGEEEAMHIRDLILDRLDLEEATRLEQVERALTGHDILDELR